MVFIQPYVEWVLETIKAKHRRPMYAGEKCIASTASGLMSRHKAELESLLDQALS